MVQFSLMLDLALGLFVDKSSVFAFDSKHQIVEGYHVPNGQSVLVV